MEVVAKHFVLIHGAGHGAWIWYKLQTLLMDAGHKVTSMDLTASGINPVQFSDDMTFSQYSEPFMKIMANLPSNEKVIVVGHSLGGLSMAFAMEKWPENISAAVFLQAFMPDTKSPPSAVIDKYVELYPPSDVLFWMDTKFSFNHGHDKPFTSMSLGPEFLKIKLQQNSPPEDYRLALMLGRIGSFFQQDLSQSPVFTKERYGSVSRVFITCDEDKTISYDFQLFMINNDPPKEIKLIKGSDHLSMFSKPQDLLQSLLEIANKYT